MSYSQKEIEELVVKPTQNYHGRSYGMLAMEFMQWLIQYNPDNQSLRDVYFLRGVDFKGYTSSLDPRYVKIGDDALSIYSDQAIFVPIIVSFGDRLNHTNLDTVQKRIDYVNQLIQMGDDPPQKNQLSIDGILPDIQWKDYRVLTPDFELDIPPPVEGKTLGQTLDVPLNNAGISETVVGGYFLLLKPLSIGKHHIFTFGNGDSGYRNQTFVELNVVSRGSGVRANQQLQSPELRAIKSIIKAKKNSGEISDQDIENYEKVLDSIS